MKEDQWVPGLVLQIFDNFRFYAQLSWIRRCHDLRAFSGKFLREKSCCPESFCFFLTLTMTMTQHALEPTNQIHWKSRAFKDNQLMLFSCLTVHDNPNHGNHTIIITIMITTAPPSHKHIDIDWYRKLWYQSSFVFLDGPRLLKWTGWLGVSVRHHFNFSTIWSFRPWESLIFWKL